MLILEERLMSVFVRGATQSEAAEARAIEHNRLLETKPNPPVSVDILDRVPVQVADKIRTIRDVKDDRHAAASRVMDAARENAASLQTWENRKRQLYENDSDISDNHPGLLQANHEIQKLSDEQKRLVARQQELSTAWQAAGTLYRRCDQYLREAESSGIRVYSGTEPKLTAGERELDGYERSARRTRALKAEGDEVRARPFPTKIAKLAAREQLRPRIEAARPDVSQLVDRLEEIEFPRTSHFVNLGAPLETNDPIGLLGWLFPEKFFVAIDKEIDAAGDDKIALSIDERIAKLAEIDADMLASERDEVHFAELAGLLPRPDIDPRAALNLGSDMPAPSRHVR
jgi:hypothetical protein